MRKVFLVLLVACSICLVPESAWAQEDTETAGTVSRVYLVQPKTGEAGQWMDAAEAHTQWHREQNDPFPWVGFYVETGQYAGMFGWTTFGHQWADFDAYDATLREGDEANVAVTTGLFTESHTSWFSDQIPALSNPPPAGDLNPLYQVIEYRVAMGKQGAFTAALTKIVATLKKGGFDQNYTWSMKIDGRGPTFSLLLPLDGWADLAPADRPFEQILAEELGAEAAGELLQAIGGATLSTNTWVVRILPNLTHMPAAE